MQKVAVFIVLILVFACKNNVHPLQRSFDTKLVDTLQKLARRYSDKKVRINTWNQKDNVYEDLAMKDPQEKTITTLTIGDSVVFINLNFSDPQEIRAQIKTADKTGFIPYWAIEELQDAKKIDPDLQR